MCRHALEIQLRSVFPSSFCHENKQKVPLKTISEILYPLKAFLYQNLYAFSMQCHESHQQNKIFPLCLRGLYGLNTAKLPYLE